MQPQRLMIRVGGFLSDTYSVELKEEGLVYCHLVQPTPPACTTLHPTDAQWHDFRATLDAIPVWHWQADYPNPPVRDGTQWRIAIAYDGKMLESTGSNAFPLEDGASNHNSSFSAPFQKLMQAVRDLTGQEFQ